MVGVLRWTGKRLDVYEEVARTDDVVWTPGKAYHQVKWLRSSRWVGARRMTVFEDECLSIIFGMQYSGLLGEYLERVSREIMRCFSWFVEHFVV